MKLEDFLTQEEGSDSRRLPDGRYASTWDPLGRVWNIGHGITVGVTKDTVWTQAQLDAAEAKEFADVVACVARSVKVPITENQRVALESLAYNIGDAGFEHSSVLRDVNAGRLAAAAQDFLLWVHAGGSVCPGLIKRRKDEIRLFQHPDDVPVPADLRAVKTPVTATTSSSQQLGTKAMDTSMPTPTNPVVAAAVQSATLPLNSIWSSIIGMFGSVATSGVLGVFATLAPTTTMSALAILGGVAALVSAISHVYAIATGVSATNNATIQLAENFINKIETGLGGKAFNFDNNPPASA